MSRIRLLTSTYTRPTLAMLAVLLLLFGSAFPSAARAQEETVNFPCLQGLGLPTELAELDLEGVQAALQELVEANPEATVILQVVEAQEDFTTIRADLLLAEEAALAALLEGQPVNVTFEPSEEEPPVVVAIEVATAEACDQSFQLECVPPIELPDALADRDVAGLRAALEEMLSGDADATVAVLLAGQPTIVRPEVLLGLADPVLEALLAGDPLNVTLDDQDGHVEIVDIALPGPECEGAGEPQEPEPKPGTIPDNQQGGGKDTGAGAGKTPDNQQGGGQTVTKTFRLTINGTVPEGEEFVVRFGTSDDEGSTVDFPLCGAGAQDECTGDGAVYSDSIEVRAGTDIDFEFERAATGEVFHEGTETITADMTNTAWYTFGKGTGAGDEQEVPDNQQDGEDKDTDTDTGAGEVPENQQDDTQEDVQDDQQGEMPEELPETGAGGLASGTTIPVGNAAAGLTLLIGAGFAALRFR